MTIQEGKQRPSNQRQQQRKEIPALTTLQTLPQWVCWRRETRTDSQGRANLTKIPYHARTGGEAKSNTSATWTSYAVAKQAYARSQRTKRPYDGLGFVFASEGNITGIDLDHCIAPDGTVDTWAQEWIERLHSYTEYSPSGEGFHIYVSGTFANPSGDIQKLKGKRHEKAAIEVYSECRYFTVTERHVDGTPGTIEANQEALDALYRHLYALDAATRPSKKQQAARSHAIISPDDEQLLKKAVEARNGEKFRALFYYGPQGYPSASEADMALCLMLAFWTGRDTTRMDRLYRKSALYREKWDTARSESTYGWDTIHKAAAVCTVVYDPRRTHAQLERDIEQVLQQIAQQQARLSTPRKRKPYQLTPKEVPTSKVLDYLDMNEYGDALFFAEVFAGQVCYDHTASEWYLWDGHAWQKDTLLGTLHDVLGAIAGAISNDVFVAQDKLKGSGAATPHLCDLQGKRLVWGSETRQGDRLNIAQIKHLSGGGEISTRPLYGKDYYTFQPTHKLLLMTNHKPHIDAKEKPAWDRVCLIEFGIRFVDRPEAANERKRDATLSGKLKEERSGILAWLVRGCLAWQEQGLAIPEPILAATSKYREEEDSLLLFIQERCIVSPEASVKAGALYEAYRKWCEENQFGRGMDGKLFGKEMGKRFSKVEVNGRRMYCGFGLLIPDTDPPTLFDEASRGSGENAPSPSTNLICEFFAIRTRRRFTSGRGSEGTRY